MVQPQFLDEKTNRLIQELFPKLNTDNPEELTDRDSLYCRLMEVVTLPTRSFDGESSGAVYFPGETSVRFQMPFPYNVLGGMSQILRVEDLLVTGHSRSLPQNTSFSETWQLGLFTFLNPDSYDQFTRTQLSFENGTQIERGTPTVNSDELAVKLSLIGKGTNNYTCSLEFHFKELKGSPIYLPSL